MCDERQRDGGFESPGVDPFAPLWIVFCAVFGALIEGGRAPPRGVDEWGLQVERETPELRERLRRIAPLREKLEGVAVGETVYAAPPLASSASKLWSKTTVATSIGVAASESDAVICCSRRMRSSLARTRSWAASAASRRARSMFRRRSMSSASSAFVRSRVISEKPRSSPAGDRRAVRYALARKRVPSFRTRTPLVSLLPSRAAAAQAAPVYPPRDPRGKEYLGKICR